MHQLWAYSSRIAAKSSGQPFLRAAAAVPRAQKARPAPILNDKCTHSLSCKFVVLEQFGVVIMQVAGNGFAANASANALMANRSKPTRYTISKRCVCTSKKQVYDRVRSCVCSLYCDSKHRLSVCVCNATDDKGALLLPFQSVC